MHKLKEPHNFVNSKGLAILHMSLGGSSGGWVGDGVTCGQIGAD